MFLPMHLQDYSRLNLLKYVFMLIADFKHVRIRWDLFLSVWSFLEVFQEFLYHLLLFNFDVRYELSVVWYWWASAETSSQYKCHSIRRITNVITTLFASFDTVRIVYDQKIKFSIFFLSMIINKVSIWNQHAYNNSQT